MGNFTLSNFERVSVGGEYKAWMATHTMSSSYATGGDGFSGTSYPFNYIKDILFPSVVASSDYTLKFDETAQKTLAYVVSGSGGAGTTDPASGGTPAGSINLNSITESPTVTGGAGTLAFVPINVTCVYATAAGTPAPLRVVPSSIVPITGQIAINFGTGAFSTFAGDAVTAITIVYQNPIGTFTGSVLGTHTHGFTGGGSISMAQVSNGTNLSSVSTRVLIFGKEV